jgi:hypothetical protein
MSSRRQSSKSEKEAEKTKSKLTEIEEAATGAVGGRVYLRYFQSIGLSLSIGAIVCNAINSATSIYSSSKNNLKSYITILSPSHLFFQSGSKHGQQTTESCSIPSIIGGATFT